MPEYLPIFLPGTSITRTASAAIVGGQLVRVSGDGLIAPTSAASGAWLGVAGHDAAPGDLVLVFREGVQRLTAAISITAGNTVEAAAGGAVGPHTNGTNDFNVVGLALTSATPGQLVEVKLSR